MTGRKLGSGCLHTLNCFLTGIYGTPPQRDEAKRNRAGMTLQRNITTLHNNEGFTMAIGKRIRFFRSRKGMTQKQLGEILFIFIFLHNFYLLVFDIFS